MSAVAEFVRLLSRPRVEKKMFKCEQTESEWATVYERWDVLYVWALLGTSLLLWLFRALSELAKFQVATVISDILFTVADLLLCILLNGISWYCVVKRLGFCGRAGYLVWAVLYVFLNIGRLQTITWSHWYLFYFLMLIPVAWCVRNGGLGVCVVS
ncbi:unnamed protein product [Durusdinium trenchii]|uniref:Uncharacterized protein n=1 Tax=Durusdinium trenchii TaxID=1381693 RepID=A0ABP0QGP6_9DINO